MLLKVPPSGGAHAWCPVSEQARLRRPLATVAMAASSAGPAAGSGAPVAADRLHDDEVAMPMNSFQRVMRSCRFTLVLRMRVEVAAPDREAPELGLRALLSQALLVVARRHPSLRTSMRRIPGLGTQLCVGSPASVRGGVADTGAASASTSGHWPVAFSNAPSDDAWRAAAVELSHATLPAHLPMWACHCLLLPPSGAVASEADVLVSVDHVICDARGLFALCSDIVRAIGLLGAGESVDAVGSLLAPYDAVDWFTRFPRTKADVINEEASSETGPAAGAAAGAATAGASRAAAISGDAAPSARDPGYAGLLRDLDADGTLQWLPHDHHPDTPPTEMPPPSLHYEHVVAKLSRDATRMLLTAAKSRGASPWSTLQAALHCVEHALLLLQPSSSSSSSASSSASGSAKTGAEGASTLRCRCVVDLRPLVDPPLPPSFVATPTSFVVSPAASVSKDTQVWGLAAELHSHVSAKLSDGEAFDRLRVNAMNASVSASVNNYGSYERLGGVAREGRCTLRDVHILVNDTLPADPFHSQLDVLCWSFDGRLSVVVGHCLAFWRRETALRVLRMLLHVVKGAVEAHDGDRGDDFTCGAAMASWREDSGSSDAAGGTGDTGDSVTYSSVP